MTNDEADDRSTVQWTSSRTTRHAWRCRVKLSAVITLQIQWQAHGPRK